VFPAASGYSSGHRPIFRGGVDVSIVRIGLGETKHFAEGYEAIFGKKSAAGKAHAQKAPTKKKKEKKRKKKG
jgi:hypothetical protein